MSDKADTIKLLFTYLICTIVVIGGGAMLYFTRNDPPSANGANLSLFIAGAIGSVLTYVLNREVSTQATRAAQSSADQGAAIGTPPLR